MSKLSDKPRDRKTPKCTLKICMQVQIVGPSIHKNYSVKKYRIANTDFAYKSTILLYNNYTYYVEI
jgi:hypothetical protein